MVASVARRLWAPCTRLGAQLSRRLLAGCALFGCINAVGARAKCHLFMIIDCNDWFFQTWQGFCLVASDSCTDAVAVTMVVRQVVQGVFSSPAIDTRCVACNWQRRVTKPDTALRLEPGLFSWGKSTNSGEVS